MQQEHVPLAVRFQVYYPELFVFSPHQQALSCKTSILLTMGQRSAVENKAGLPPKD
jgi:hypothetical protein